MAWQDVRSVYVEQDDDPADDGRVAAADAYDERERAFDAWAAGTVTCPAEGCYGGLRWDNGVCPTCNGYGRVRKAAA